MKWKLLRVAVLVAITGLASQAQQKNEVAAIIGRTFVSNQGVIPVNGREVHFGNGLTYEVNYARRIFSRDLLALTVEVPLVVEPTQKLNFYLNLVPKSYSSFFMTPALRVNIFPATRLFPWASFGGGLGHFGESSDLEFGGQNPGKSGTTTGTLQLGAGLDIRLWRSLSIRAQARDFYSGVPQINVDTGKTRQHNYFVGGGPVWRF